MENGPGLKMSFLLKMGRFHCYVSLPEGSFPYLILVERNLYRLIGLVELPWCPKFLYIQFGGCTRLIAQVTRLFSAIYRDDYHLLPYNDPLRGPPIVDPNSLIFCNENLVTSKVLEFHRCHQFIHASRDDHQRLGEVSQWILVDFGVF